MRIDKFLKVSRVIKRRSAARDACDASRIIINGKSVKPAKEVKVGDVVKDGDTVVVLEAMKMQNNIETEFSGTVTSILVNQGDSVLEGAVLLTIA